MIWRSQASALVVAAALAATLGIAEPSARAADANATAVGVAPDVPGVFVGGSARFANDPRSGVAGRWNVARGAFDWLERVDAARGAADGFTSIVPLGAFVYGIGYANGRLMVAKMDAATGALQRACGPGGVRLSSLGASVLPRRAVAVDGKIVVVGATHETPSRGMLAAVDPGNCKWLRTAFVAAEAPAPDISFTSVDVEPSGNLLVSGSSGAKATLFRFDSDLSPLSKRTFDLGGSATAGFSDARAGSGRGVAVGRVGSQLLAQCFTLPDLDPDAGCGSAGLRSLSFDWRGVPAGHVTLGRLPSGSWLVAGSHAGTAGFATTQARPAVGAFEPAGLGTDADVFAPTGTQVFDPFPILPAGFRAVTASTAGIAGVGTSGYRGDRRPFLFSSALDGTKPTFTALTTLDTAARAPVAAAPPPPPSPRPVTKPAARVRRNT